MYCCNFFLIIIIIIININNTIKSISHNEPANIDKGNSVTLTGHIDQHYG